MSKRMHFQTTCVPFLQRRKHKRKTVTRRVAQFWAACIVSALDYLHKQNIIHRDLKTANALLARGVVCVFPIGTAIHT